MSSLDSEKTYYPSHSYDSKDYLHYYLINDINTVAKVWEIIGNVKQKIFADWSLIMQKRLSQQYGAVGLSPDLSTNDLNIIERLLEGRMFQNFNLDRDYDRVKDPNSQVVSYGTHDDFSQARQSLKELSSTVENMQQFISELKQVIQKITGLTPAILKQYTDYVVKEATKTKGNNSILSKGQSSNVETKAQQGILQGLLTRHNEQFFKTVSSSLNLPVEVGKMIALVAALPAAENIQIESSQLPSSQQNDSVQEIAEKKFQNWISYLDKKVEKYYLWQGLIEANWEFFNKEQEILGPVILEGKEITTSIDPQIQYYLNEGQSIHNQGYQKATSNIGVALHREGGTITSGINILNYKNFKIQTGQGFDTVTGKFNIKSNITLLDALMKESLMKSDELHQVLQFLVGHESDEYIHGRGWTVGGSGYTDETFLAEWESATGETGNSNYNYQWNELLNYLTYRMFLGAILGLDVWDTAWYVSLNGRIYKAATFLGSFLMSQNSKLNLKHLSSSTGSLDRQDYVDINTWINDKRGRRQLSRVLAEERSEKTEHLALSMLRSTKISIQVNMKNLQILNYL